MRWQQWYSLIVIVQISLSPLVAQRLLDRFVPYVVDIAYIDQMDQSFRSWGGFEGYLYQSDSLHGWRQVMGAMVDFWRQDTTVLLSFVSSIEFHANFNNDIRFNPRAQFWEEGLILSFFSPQWIWQTGYLHRCKHDIDNLALNQERTLIYGSVFLNGYWKPLITTARNGLLLGFSTHLFLIAEDYRTPSFQVIIDPSIATLLNTTVLSMRGKHRLGTQQFYTHLVFQLSIFSRESAFLKRLSTPTATAFSFYSALEWQFSPIGRLRFSMEYLHDTAIPVIPQSALQLQVGLYFRTNGLW